MTDEENEAMLGIEERSDESFAEDEFDVDAATIGWEDDEDDEPTLPYVADILAV
jgi:hypothetical protein